MSAEQHISLDRSSGSSGSIGRGKAWSAAALAFLRAHVIALAILACVLLIYTLVGFLLVPRIARNYAQEYVADTLHKKLSIGEVRFNPFAFDASVAGLMLSEPDGRPMLAFRHLYVNAQLSSLWRRAMVLKEIDLSAPDVRVVVAQDGSVNLASLKPPPTAEPAPAQDSAPPRIHIGRLSVGNGRVGLEDHTRAQPFVAAVEPIRFTLMNFKTDAGYRNAYRFAGTTTAGEALEWSGGFTVQPLGSAGQFTVQGLKLATIDAYLSDSLPVRLASGEVSLKGDYQLALDPFALDLALPLTTVRNLSLTERTSGGATPISAAEIDAQQLTFSTQRRNVGVQRIDVRGARVDVAREQDGTINLQRLFAAKPAAEAATTEETPNLSAATPTWSTRVEAIHIENGSIFADDRAVTPAARFELTPLNLTVHGWSADPKTRVRIDGNVAINQDGKLAVKGEAQLDPLDVALALDLAGFALPAVQPYLEQATALTLHSGALSAKGDLAYAARAEAGAALKFSGDVRVADLRTTDQFVNQDFLKWRDLAVSGISFQHNPDKLEIDRIVARQPYTSVIIAQDASLNVVHVLRDDEAKGESEQQDPDADRGQRQDATAAPRVTADRAFPISIRTVQVVDGAASFADNSIEPSFAAAILELNGKVTGLSSKPDSRAQVALIGKVDRYAPVDITGEVNLLSAAKYTALAMNFRNMELPTFNPYSGKFAGYNISKGKLTTELKYRIEDRNLLAEHHVVVDNLEFGDKTDSRDAAPIPIKLAVALLKDRNGVIDLDLPVSGTLDDPKFRLGPVIWKALLGLLTKVVTAPFAALGALFGGGDELAFVNFAPGSAELAVAEREKLDKLARALAERPQLRLDVPLTLLDAEDARARARQAIDGLIPPDADSAIEPARRLAQLEAAYRSATKSAPDYPQETRTEEGIDVEARLRWIEDALLEKLRPTQAELDAMARERAQAVQAALLSNAAINPERVFITTDRKATAVDGAIRMEMKLE